MVFCLRGAVVLAVFPPSLSEMCVREREGRVGRETERQTERGRERKREREREKEILERQSLAHGLSIVVLRDRIHVI